MYLSSRFRHLVLLTCISAAPVMLVQAQFPGGGGQDRSGPDTKLNLGALGNINNTTPKVVPQRVLQGVVRDKDGTPLKGAMVYLKDDKSTNIRSMLADDKGAFRFVQLSRSGEYKVWAQSQEKRSPVKAVSSFETKDEITRNLQME